MTVNISARMYHDADMPSRDEVMRLVDAAPKLQKSVLSCVAKISDKIVVKYGPNVHLSEARNMMLAATVPEVRVPKLFDAWETIQGSESGRNESVITYLVMEHIPGTTVMLAWPTLVPKEKERLAEQIATSMHAIHRLKLAHPGPVGGGISKGFFFTAYDAGPFETAADMEDWFSNRQQVCKELGYVDINEPDFSGKFKELVFCHMDIHFDNLLLDHHGNLWILDWAHAGGYPIFFEEAEIKFSGNEASTKWLILAVSTNAHQKELAHLRGIQFAVTTGVLLQPRSPDDLESSLPPPPSPKLVDVLG